MKYNIDKLTDNKLAKSKSFRQLVKYGIVGMLGLVIDLGVFYVLNEKLDIHYLISHLISNTLAIVNNFILNSYFTFRVTDKKLKRFLSFAAVAGVGVIISSLLLTLFIEVVGMHNMVAKACAVLIVAMLQFVINKFFTFKQKN